MPDDRKEWLLVTRSLSLLVAAVLTPFTPASGVSQSLDSADVYSFDLDTQSGHFSSWTVETLRHERLRARLIVGELRKNNRWAPAFGLWLNGSDQRAVLRIWAPQRKPPLVVQLIGSRSEGRADSAAFTQVIAREDTFDIELDWSRAGTLRAVLDSGEAHEVRLAFKPTSFQVTSSTGQIKAATLVLYRQR